jgi:hypothetical protein
MGAPLSMRRMDLDGQLTQGLCVSQCVSGAALVSVINTYFPLPEREATGLGLNVVVAVSSGASAGES